jgi:hypothetical protein
LELSDVILQGVHDLLKQAGKSIPFSTIDHRKLNAAIRAFQVASESQRIDAGQRPGYAIANAENSIPTRITVLGPEVVDAFQAFMEPPDE